MLSEKEKMINGYLYKDMDETLVADRARAKLLCYEYNQLSPAKVEEKKKLIKELFGKTGERFVIEPTLQCDYGYNIECGENFYSNHNLVILDCAKVTFGENVFIAPNCGFYAALHPLNAELRVSGGEFALPITVGNNVWK